MKDGPPSCGVAADPLRCAPLPGGQVGSYTPLEKWLKDRRGRILSGDDRRHYETFATAIGKVRAELPGAEEVWQLIRSGNWFNPLK